MSGAIARLLPLFRWNPAGSEMTAGAFERRTLRTRIETLAATRPEGAALRQIEQRRRRARDRDQTLGSGTFERWDRVEQAPGIGMLRATEYFFLGARFDDAAGIHDDD